MKYLGNLALNLIFEFLQHYNLKYTLDVFKKECRMYGAAPRDKLINDLGMKAAPDSSSSIFVGVI